MIKLAIILSLATMVSIIGKLKVLKVLKVQHITKSAGDTKTLHTARAPYHPYRSHCVAYPGAF